MQWSPAGSLPFLLLRPPGSLTPPPSGLPHKEELLDLTEGPALVPVGAPARVAHQASCVLDCL